MEKIIIAGIGIFLLIVFMTKVYLIIQNNLLRKTYTSRKKVICYIFAFSYIISFIFLAILVIYFSEVIFNETLSNYGISDFMTTIPLILGFLYVVLFKLKDIIWINENISRPTNTPPIDVLKENNSGSLK